MKHKQQCSVCHGNKIVESSKTGIPYKCPICEGMGSLQQYERLPRVYPFGNVTSFALDAGAPGTVLGVDTTINGNYDFEMIELICGFYTGDFESQIFDQSTRGWQDPGVWVRRTNRFGSSADYPFIFPAPMILNKKETISANFRDQSGGANTIQACMVGYDLHEALPEND